MENLCLKIMNKNMEALAVARGENEVNLVYTGEYQEGDIIILEVSEGSHYAWLPMGRCHRKVHGISDGKCNLQDPLRRPPDQPVSESICWEEASAVSKAGQRIRDTVLPESGSKCM